MLELLIFSPGKINVGLSSLLVGLLGDIFDLTLLLEVVHGVTPLQVIRYV